MPRLNTATRRRVALGLLALMSGIWLLASAAPCMMATPHCPLRGGVPCENMDPDSGPAVAECDTLQAVDYLRADAVLADPVVTPEAPMSLTRLVTIAPIAIQPIRGTYPMHPERYVLRPPPPPLYLRLGVLLI